MFLSARYTFGSWDKNWDSYIKWVGLECVDEIRTMDTSLNMYPADWGAIECTAETLSSSFKFLPEIDRRRQYYQLAINLSKEEIPNWLAYARFLGCDLIDSSWTSSVLNCGRWRGDLRAIARRINQYGLLRQADAQHVKDILPTIWKNDPHAIVDVWALFDVSDIKPEQTQTLAPSDSEARKENRSE